jgi:hypothetical protein
VLDHRPADDFQAVACLEQAMVAEGADAILAKVRVREQALDEVLPYLARGPGYENELHALLHFLTDTAEPARTSVADHTPTSKPS